VAHLCILVSTAPNLLKEVLRWDRKNALRSVLDLVRSLVSDACRALLISSLLQAQTIFISDWASDRKGQFRTSNFRRIKFV
jgi:hypothetical protein